jgi:hypothetical protein
MKQDHEFDANVPIEVQREGVRFLRAFGRIKDPAVRQRLIDDAERAVRDQRQATSFDH